MTSLTPNLPASQLPLSDATSRAITDKLNAWLVDLIALGLRLKQAHWNLRGARFKSIHEHFDEILADVRSAVDEVAERAVTVGGTADGRPTAVATKSTLAEFPEGLLSVTTAIQTCCEDLAHVIKRGRMVWNDLESTDPVSSDLLIRVLGSLEKHHWMLRAQEEA